MPVRDDKKKNTHLLAELGRRGVYQAVGLYVAIAWGSTEIILTASERLSWPFWLGDAALILFLTALPFVVLLSWAFDLTGHGLRRMEPGSLAGKAVIAAVSTIILGISSTWFLWHDADSGSSRQIELDQDSRPVIAVLPFKDLSGQGHGEWLPLAFTDEIISRINAHPDLVALDLRSVNHPDMEQRLQSESSPAFQVRGTLLPAAVGTLVRVRMLNAAGNVLWEHEHVFELRDAQAMSAAQKWVSGQVATGLGRSLGGVDYCEPSVNTEAIKLYQEAKERFSKRGPANVATAAKMLEKATTLDPRFARGLELLSEVYKRFYHWVTQDPSQYGMTEDELEVFLSGQPELEPARRALDLCPTLGAAYFTVEISAPVDHSFADAVELMEEALRRDPANVLLMGRLVEFLMRMGHVKRADALAQEMYLRDPLNTRIPHVLALTQEFLGNSKRAIELENESLALGYDLNNSLPLLSSIYVAMGDEAALEQLLGGMFTPSKRIPVDPRRVLLALNDNSVKAELVGTYRKLVEEADVQNIQSLAGWAGNSLALDLGDEGLAWLIMERWAEISAPSDMPYAFWHPRYRHWFGNSRMQQLGSFSGYWSDFWDRKGPPDGCSWDGKNLACEWATHN
jgi:TolB-like protein